MSEVILHSIIIDRLSAGYQVNNSYLPVLKNISTKVQPGQLICLMGPNGAGKSTFLRCIAGLQEYKSGSILIDNNPVGSLTSHMLSKKLSIVLTEPVAVPHMTVRELLAMGRYPHLSWLLKFSKEDKNTIEKTAGDCGISELMDKPVQSLSDGQRQKVLIGRAMVQESSILLLDEPTSHLDLNNRVEIINLLKQVSRKEKKTIIMATHELDLALQMADNILLLNNEGDLLEGIPEDLVLNGKLDEVFSFKGFDLKTGKVNHQKTDRSITLIGEGHIYMWTKNALEREGYEVMQDAKDKIIIHSSDHEIFWTKAEQRYSTIQSLLEDLKKGR